MVSPFGVYGVPEMDQLTEARLEVAPLEAGEVINECYNYEEYVYRRANMLGKHPDFATQGAGIFVIARRDACILFRAEDSEDDLSVQEVRRREESELLFPLLPLPTKSNTQTLNDFADYGAQEWTPSQTLPGSPAAASVKASPTRQQASPVVQLHAPAFATPPTTSHVHSTTSVKGFANVNGAVHCPSIDVTSQSTFPKIARSAPASPIYRFAETTSRSRSLPPNVHAADAAQNLPTKETRNLPNPADIATTTSTQAPNGNADGDTFCAPSLPNPNFVARTPTFSPITPAADTELIASPFTPDWAYPESNKSFSDSPPRPDQGTEVPQARETSTTTTGDTPAIAAPGVSALKDRGIHVEVKQGIKRGRPFRADQAQQEAEEDALLSPTLQKRQKTNHSSSGTKRARSTDPPLPSADTLALSDVAEPVPKKAKTTKGVTMLVAKKPEAVKGAAKSAMRSDDLPSRDSYESNSGGEDSDLMFRVKYKHELPRRQAGAKGVARPVNKKRQAPPDDEDEGDSKPETRNATTKPASKRQKTGTGKPGPHAADLDPIISGAAQPKSSQQAASAAAERKARLLAQHRAGAGATARRASRKDPDLLPEFFYPHNYPRGDEHNAVRCLCGDTHDDGSEMVACNACLVWEHVRCIGPARPRDLERDEHRCRQCDPWRHRHQLQRLRRGEPLY